jgi:hypothetical protein
MEVRQVPERDATEFERDRAIVRAMRLVGETDELIEDFLTCLDLDEGDRQELRHVAGLMPIAPAADMTSGDVIEMNPLTAQPQRSKQR